MEIIIIISIIILFSLITFYWYNDHKYKNVPNYDHTLVLMRTFGSLANTILAVLLIFITKNSIFNKIFNISYEGVI